MQSAIRQLQDLGFGQYEAQAYVALLQRSPLNGYELAKLSGVPRANIYSVLQKLEERGAVVRQDTLDGARFAPILPEMLIDGLRNRLQSNLESAQEALCRIDQGSEAEGVWHARGYPLLLELARQLAGAAGREILVAISPAEARALASDLKAAQERGTHITTLCTAGCPEECGACRGQIHRYHLSTGGGRRALLLVADRAEVLAGEIDAQEEAEAVRTRQPLLVDLAAWHIEAGAALGAILQDLGDRLPDLLSARARTALADLGTDRSSGGWLAHMLGQLNFGPGQQDFTAEARRAQRGLG